MRRASTVDGYNGHDEHTTNPLSFADGRIASMKLAILYNNLKYDRRLTREASALKRTDANSQKVLGSINTILCSPLSIIEIVPQNIHNSNNGKCFIYMYTVRKKSD